MNKPGVILTVLALLTAGGAVRPATAGGESAALPIGEKGEERLPQPDPTERRLGDRAPNVLRQVVGRVSEVAGSRLKLNLGLDFDITEGDTLEVYRRIEVVNTMTERMVKLTWRLGTVIIEESAGSSSIGRFESYSIGEPAREGDEVRITVPESVIRSGSGVKP